jgi:hypothetical protein
LEELPLVFRSKISGGDSTHPDLQFGIFIGCLEASFSWAEIVGLTVFMRVHLHLGIQHLEENPLVFRFEISGGDSTHPDLQFGIFIRVFGDFLQLGRNLDLLISSVGCAISQGALDVTLVLFALTFIVYSTFGGLFCLIGNIL